MDKAMETGKIENNPAAVIKTLRMTAHQMGMGDKLNNPEIDNILSSFEQQSKDNVIPHAFKMAKEIGVLSLIMKHWGGNKQ